MGPVPTGLPEKSLIPALSSLPEDALIEIAVVIYSRNAIWFLLGLKSWSSSSIS